MARQPTPELGDDAKLRDLTPRERDVLALIAVGSSNREIATCDRRRKIDSEDACETHSDEAGPSRSSASCYFRLRIGVHSAWRQARTSAEPSDSNGAARGCGASSQVLALIAIPLAKLSTHNPPYPANQGMIGEQASGALYGDFDVRLLSRLMLERRAGTRHHSLRGRRTNELASVVQHRFGSWYTIRSVRLHFATSHDCFATTGLPDVTVPVPPSKR